MVRQYYVPQITELSEQELQTVFATAVPPICLLGGWAVHLQVTPGFRREHGREYIGSRDIDLGIHVNPAWTPKELAGNAIGATLEGIEDLGYTRSRFGFVQAFHREDNRRLTEREASSLAQHQLFNVYIDIIPDTAELENFREAFGFTPPAEPLLGPVFENDGGEPLSEYVSWEIGEDVLIAPPELLAAMKICSLPDRDKSHKRVKDIADLHALLWYTTPYDEIREAVTGYVSEEEVTRVEEVVSEELFTEAAQLLQIDPAPLQESIRRLTSL